MPSPLSRMLTSLNSPVSHQHCPSTNGQHHLNNLVRRLRASDWSRSFRVQSYPALEQPTAGYKQTGCPLRGRGISSFTQSKAPACPMGLLKSVPAKLQAQTWEIPYQASKTNMWDRIWKRRPSSVPAHPWASPSLCFHPQFIQKLLLLTLPIPVPVLHQDSHWQCSTHLPTGAASFCVVQHHREDSWGFPPAILHTPGSKFHWIGEILK